MFIRANYLQIQFQRKIKISISFFNSRIFIVYYSSILSSKSKEGEDLIKISHHLFWTTFTRTIIIKNDYLRVITYILFLNCGIIYFLLKIYLDDQQNVLKYLKSTEANLNNILVMIGDFNIRDSNCDLSYHTTQYILILFLKQLIVLIQIYSHLLIWYLLSIPTILKTLTQL